jgi:GNAT superfamily N-acetyltransferase
MIRQLKVEEFDKFLDLAIVHHTDAGLPERDTIDRGYSKKQLRNMYIYQNWRIYIAEEGDKITGYIAGYVDRKLWNNTLFGEIVLLFVHPEHRSKLVADQLFDTMVDWFSSVGCEYYLASCMSWTNEYERVDAWSDRATKYFKSRNMKEVGYTYIQPIDRGF